MHVSVQVCMGVSAGMGVSRCVCRGRIKTKNGDHCLLECQRQENGEKSECWGECGEKGTLIDGWWECKLVHPIWETVHKFLKLKIQQP